METMIKGASRLLGDCKVSNIGKEIKKLKQEDNLELKTHIAYLKLQINDLQVIVKVEDAEVRRLQAKMEGLEKIRAFIGHTSDVVTKAHLFDNEIKTEDHLSQQKIVTILVKFAGRIEDALVEMQKLSAGTTEAGSSQPPDQPAISPSSKEKAQLLMEELKECLQERKVQEALTKAAKIVVPPPEGAPAAVPETTPKGKSKEKESKSRATSSEPSAQKSGKRKARTPSPKLEEEEELLDDKTNSSKSEEEEEPSTPIPDQRLGKNTRSASKKPLPLYNSSTARQQTKTPTETHGKKEGSTKKPKGK